MERILEFKINCGEKTCASEPGKFCEFFGTKKFGQLPLCTLFPEFNAYTELKEENGWTQRCPACLKAEKKQNLHPDHIEAIQVLRKIRNIIQIHYTADNIYEMICDILHNSNRGCIGADLEIKNDSK